MEGQNTATTGNGAGVVGSTSSGFGYGVYGINSSSGGYAIYGTSNGYAVYGQGTNAGSGGYFTAATGGYGVLASSDSGPGVLGTSNSANGVEGESSTNIGVNGISTSYDGVYGTSSTGKGVHGYSTSSYGVYGSSGSSYAGYFSGNLYVSGAITAGTKDFKIDHPLDPANKYLVHSCVESNEMADIYSGNAILDSDGKAWVEMPDYFEALNTDFRYQLTCIGGFAPVYVEKKIEHNRFLIAGGKPGLEISWLVTGIRHDRYAEAHPLVVEEEKTGKERGRYIHPVEFGKPKTLAVDYEMTRQAMVKPKMPHIPKVPPIPKAPVIYRNIPLPLGHPAPQTTTIRHPNQ